MKSMCSSFLQKRLQFLPKITTNDYFNDHIKCYISLDSSESANSSTGQPKGRFIIYGQGGGRRFLFSRPPKISAPIFKTTHECEWSLQRGGAGSFCRPCFRRDFLHLLYMSSDFTHFQLEYLHQTFRIYQWHGLVDARPFFWSKKFLGSKVTAQKGVKRLKSISSYSF